MTIGWRELINVRPGQTTTVIRGRIRKIRRNTWLSIMIVHFRAVYENIRQNTMVHDRIEQVYDRLRMYTRSVIVDLGGI